MREKLTVYSFTVQWVEGKTHYIADALSRYPVFNPDQSIDAPEPEQPEIVTCMRATDNRGIDDIIKHIDEDYKLVADAVESDQNWKKISRRHPANQYKGIMHRLTIHRTGPKQQDKIILLDRTRIVIPTKARQGIFCSLHTAHSCLSLIHI